MTLPFSSSLCHYFTGFLLSFVNIIILYSCFLPPPHNHPHHDTFNHTALKSNTRKVFSFFCAVTSSLSSSSASLLLSYKCSASQRAQAKCFWFPYLEGSLSCFNEALDLPRRSSTPRVTQKKWAGGALSAVV